MLTKSFLVEICSPGWKTLSLEGRTAELALTARNFSASEAENIGLVTHISSTQASMTAAARKMAAQIAQKSPIAVTGTKRVLLHAR